MKRTIFADSHCPIARTTDLMGDWWTPIVRPEAVSGRRRFDEFQKALSLSPGVLTQRLNRLVLDEFSLTPKTRVGTGKPRPALVAPGIFPGGRAAEQSRNEQAKEEETKEEQAEGYGQAHIR